MGWEPCLVNCTYHNQKSVTKSASILVLKHTKEVNSCKKEKKKQKNQLQIFKQSEKNNYE